jgi:hypothetical protein
VYLAELTRRGHAGRMLGVDLSAGCCGPPGRGCPTRPWLRATRRRCH